MTFRITAEEKRLLVALAARRSISISDCLRHLIRREGRRELKRKQT